MSAHSKSQPAIEKFWECIPPLWHATRATIRGVAVEKFQLSVEQFQVLRRIRRGTDSVSSLAEISRTSRPAVSKAVDILVNKGLVTRTQQTHDRRHVRLALTPDGQRVMTAIYAGTEAWLAARLERLSIAELATVTAGLGLLQRAFLEDD